jgi:hypothetical protein
MVETEIIVTGYGFEKRWKLVREEEQVVIIGVGG